MRLDADVVLPLPRDPAELRQVGGDIRPVGDEAVFDRLGQQGGDALPVRREPPPVPQCRLPPLELEGRRRRVPPSRRIVRIGPAVPEVVHVPERPIVVQPAGRRDVERPAGLQVAAGGKDMDVDTAVRLPVQHRRPAASVRREAGEGQLPEIVEHGIDLRVVRPVLRRPCDHAGRVAVLEPQAVGDRGDLVGIAAQDLDAGALDAQRVGGGQHVPGGLPGRAGAVPQERDQHRLSGPGCSAASRSSIDASSARIRRRCGCADPFTRRAIWFRLLPIRAICAVRAAAAAASPGDQGRTRPSDRRTRSESGMPAASASERQWLISSVEARTRRLWVRAISGTGDAGGHAAAVGSKGGAALPRQGARGGTPLRAKRRMGVWGGGCLPALGGSRGGRSAFPARSDGIERQRGYGG